MRGICIVFIAAVAGCGDSHSSAIKCGMGTSGTLTAGGSVEVTAGDGPDRRRDRRRHPHDAALRRRRRSHAPPTSRPPGSPRSAPRSASAPRARGPTAPFLLTLPYKAARLPKHATPGAVRIVAQAPRPARAFFPAVANRTLDDADAYASRATFKASELTTYQVVAADDAGTERDPAVRLERDHRRLDGRQRRDDARPASTPTGSTSIVDLGGEPGPSMIYTLGMIRDVPVRRLLHRRRRGSRPRHGRPAVPGDDRQARAVRDRVPTSSTWSTRTATASV